VISPSIVTVTPNPSVDRTLRIPPLERGSVLRATSATAEAGGKGINVSRALLTQGVTTAAVVPLSAPSAALLGELLDPGWPLEQVIIDGDIRVNISLVEADGTVTKVNEPGPPLGDADVTALIDRVIALADGAAWVVGCGSLPPGAPNDLYARIAARLPTGARMAVDADGAALRACRGQALALLKPNRNELAGLVGRDLDTLGEVLDAAREVLRDGAASILVSLGADGALLVDEREAAHAEARIEDAVNPVGAGDALLAGFLAGGATMAALSTAVAWSVAACRSMGTRMQPVTEADCAAVIVHETLDRSRRLQA
jgi:1-phosphofructokinase